MCVCVCVHVCMYERGFCERPFLAKSASTEGIDFEFCFFNLWQAAGVRSERDEAGKETKRTAGARGAPA